MYQSEPLTDQIRPFTVTFITQTYSLLTVGVFAYFQSSYVYVELYTLNIFGMFYEHDILLEKWIKLKWTHGAYIIINLQDL